MIDYNDVVKKQVRAWKIRSLKNENSLSRMTKGIQVKINKKIPQRVHAVITHTVKGIIHSVIFSLKFIPNEPPSIGLDLEARDRLAWRTLVKYRKIASLEGAGTGAGGFLLGMADFPALIAIKMQMLFELAHIYGYDTRNKEERFFLLYIFQITFTTADQRKHLFPIIEGWNEVALTDINWEQFQKDYRDSLDLRKMLQLIPGVGAIVGAWANYGLLRELGIAAINCFRIRHLGLNEL
ncbi:MAG: EcsC family protein [Firmicutes bacterium]|nr:EcsC family protein [Bacillota bacterium]